jgi:WD40 repeat protein/Flp pilus assembly protein TadD/tRNA A-37 threonylcarbamoyl transferase component Bud32
MGRHETTAAAPPTGDPAFDLLIDGLLARLDAGEVIDWSAVVREHPGYADQLRALAPALAALGELSPASRVPAGPAAPAAGMLGDFHILREVGRGGMGVVYEAEQLSLGRRVALKVLPFAAVMDPRSLQRFKNEARAAAALDHPHVVKVYAVGAERGVHYIAMQFIDGRTLADLIRERREPGAAPADPTRPVAGAVTAPTPGDAAHFRRAAEWAAQAAEALEHAHGLGIVHRDVKPGNLMVDGRGHLWVTDFGLAQVAADPGQTHTGDLLGTPRYMSPEQALAKHGLVDHRTDVYALGATLYELLTLAAAVGGRDREEVLHNLAFADPVPPRRLDGRVPGELGLVCLKCLAKEPADRYATAGELAADLRRWLEGKAVLARQPGLGPRLRRWARRNRPAVAATVAILVLLVSAAVAGLAVNNALVTRERDQTRAEEREGRRLLHDALQSQARATRFSRQIGQRFESWEVLAEAARLARELELGEDRLQELRTEAIACLALTDIRRVGACKAWPQGSEGVAFAADLRFYARSDPKGNISVRRLGDDGELALLRGEGPGGPNTGAPSVWFSPDGNLLAARHHQSGGQATNFRLWDWRLGKVIFQLPSAADWVSVDFSPDGRHLALGQPNGTLSIHEAATGKEVRQLSPGVSPFCLSYHPDGGKLAVAGPGGRAVQVRDVATDKVLGEWRVPSGAWTLSWHPAGKLLVLGCDDGNLYLRDTSTGEEQAVLRGHQGYVVAVAFAPSGDVVMSWSWDGTSRLWDPWTGRELLRFAGWDSRLSRDGRRLAARVAGDLTVWDLAFAREYRSLPRSPVAGREQYGHGDVHPDGRWLALGTARSARLWDLARATELEFLPLSQMNDVRFHPNGRELFTSGPAGLYHWPVDVRPGNLRIGPPRKLPVTGHPGQISLDRDGRTLAVADWTTGCRILDLARPDAHARSFRLPGAIRAALSPDGRWLASSIHRGTVAKVWDLRTRFEENLAVSSGTVTFSPDGRWLVTGTNYQIALWAVGSWNEPARRIRCEGIVGGAVAFTRDGKVMAVHVSPSRVQLHELASGRVLANLEAPETPPLGWLGFSPDGSQLVSAASSTTTGSAWVWDLRQVRERLREIGLDWDQPPYPPAAGEAEPVQIEVDLGRYDLGFEAGPYVQRADQSGRGGRWAAAAADLDRAIELDPGNHFTWHNLSVLRLELGDADGYRQACREMLARFGRTRDPNEAERTAKTCCLAAGSVSDSGPVLKLAGQAVVGTETNGDYPWFLLARGLAEYRAGRFAAAIDCVRKSQTPSSDNPYRDGLGHLVLAMAYHRLGRADEARRALVDARAVGEQLPKPGQGELGNWPDWLRFHIIRREAEALLGPTAEAPPKKD